MNCPGTRGEGDRSGAQSVVGGSSTRLSLELIQLVWGYAQPVAGPLNLQIARGERVGLTGANGTGKSTLLKAIQGEARVHAGEMFVDASDIAYQPQVPVRLEQMPWSVREQLDVLGASTLELPETLHPTLNRRADRLSGGQLQLFAIWGVLAGPADLVLLDEPTSYLDPEHADIVEASLLTMDEEKSAIIVSHDRGFIERTCSRCVELADRIGAEIPHD